MAKFTYIGDHAQVTMFGVVFAQGQAVETDLPILLRKLPGNCDFAQAVDVEALATEPGGEPEEALNVSIMNKAEMKDALDAKGIAYPANANKETLAALLAGVDDLA